MVSSEMIFSKTINELKKGIYEFTSIEIHTHLKRYRFPKTHCKILRANFCYQNRLHKMRLTSLVELVNMATSVKST